MTHAVMDVNYGLELCVGLIYVKYLWFRICAVTV